MQGWLIYKGSLLLTAEYIQFPICTKATNNYFSLFFSSSLILFISSFSPSIHTIISSIVLTAMYTSHSFPTACKLASLTL
jgi:hypothetical protein